MDAKERALRIEELWKRNRTKWKLWHSQRPVYEKIRATWGEGPFADFEAPEKRSALYQAYQDCNAEWGSDRTRALAAWSDGYVDSPRWKWLGLSFLAALPCLALVLGRVWLRWLLKPT